MESDLHDMSLPGSRESETNLPQKQFTYEIKAQTGFYCFFKKSNKQFTISECLKQVCLANKALNKIRSPFQKVYQSYYNQGLNDQQESIYLIERDYFAKQNGIPKILLLQGLDRDTKINELESNLKEMKKKVEQTLLERKESFRKAREEAERKEQQTSSPDIAKD